MSEPDQERGQREVPGELVQEGGMKSREAVVTIGAMVGVDLKPPWECRWLAEELLVEVVANSADRLCDEQPGRRRVQESGDVGVVATQAPDADGGSDRYSAPDAQTALPDGERAPPVVRHLIPARGQVVEPPA